jgi:hypothetical protein
MRRLLPVALLLLVLSGCSQGAGGAFSQTASPSPLTGGPTPQPRLDVAALGGLRARAAGALLRHLPGGVADVSWGAGTDVAPAGPFAAAAPETDAAALQALGSLVRTTTAGSPPGSDVLAATSAATADAFRELDGPRGGAYLLYADAAHPGNPVAPYPVDPSPKACPAGSTAGQCGLGAVSDALLSTWYATDTRRFFKVGETSTVYRPVDAIAVGSALVVAGFQARDDRKIDAGAQILDREMKADVDPHFGMLFGLVTATAQGGRGTTDYKTHLADQAGAAEALLEAFDASREQAYMADARKLLQPLMDEAVNLRAASGGYIDGFDLQSAGPAEATPADVLATILVLQAAHHYDRDDGGHFVHLVETAAGTLVAALEADRKLGGDPASGLPIRVAGPGAASRSGLATSLAVTVLGDVLGDALPPSPSPG